MYIFTVPAKAYDVPFTYEGLTAFVNAGKSGWYRKLGTTLKVQFMVTGFAVVLYDTVIARVYEDRVEISDAVNNHGSQATTFWIQKVLADNGVGGIVGREKSKYSQAGKTFKKVSV